MKLWQKSESVNINKIIEIFTIGKDKEYDLLLAPADILGNMAHAIMLAQIGLLEKQEAQILLDTLKEIYFDKKDFVIDEGIEDVHSQIEFLLTKKLGDLGKRIHAGRSRNDQVLVDLKLFFRSKIENIIVQIEGLFEALITQSNLNKNLLLPGYTHLQIAMPSSFGLWFGAYAESLVDDLIVLKGAFDIINKNPLGSGAGYGSSFPLNRKLTTTLLGFNDLNYNVVYAQMTRGKSEQILAQAIGNIAQTLSRLAMDVCLFNSQNFSYISLPSEMTTGSSIMPHKKNPDVAELIRAKSNKLKSLPTEIAFILSNLPSGYHRDMQTIKECIFPGITEIEDLLDISTFMVKNLQPKENLLEDVKFDLLFSVENVNSEVMKGMPFRDAYIKVGNEIESGQFEPNKDLNHTLEGSIGNLCNDEISNNFLAVKNSFGFKEINEKLGNLLNYKII